jgi:hypothetical protein
MKISMFILCIQVNRASVPGVRFLQVDNFFVDGEEEDDDDTAFDFYIPSGIVLNPISSMLGDSAENKVQVQESIEINYTSSLLSTVRLTMHKEGVPLSPTPSPSSKVDNVIVPINSSAYNGVSVVSVAAANSVEKSAGLPGSTDVGGGSDSDSDVSYEDFLRGSLRKHIKNDGVQNVIETLEFSDTEIDEEIVEERTAAKVREEAQTTNSMGSRDRGVIGGKKEVGQEMDEKEGGEGASLAGMIQALASLKQHSARYGDISEQMLRQAVGQHGQTEAEAAGTEGGGGSVSCAEAPTRWLDAVEAFDPSEF